MLQVLDVKDWASKDGWSVCIEGVDVTSVGSIASRVCQGGGVFALMCMQGLIDGVLLALGPRMGNAVWAKEASGSHGIRLGKFLGCHPPEGAGRGVKLLYPRPKVDHCTLDEAHNLQVTRPHLVGTCPSCTTCN